MNGKLFDFINADFFKPLTSMYKDRFLDCILHIYEICRNEFSYSALRNEIVENLAVYFEPDENEFIFEGERDVACSAREKANGFLRQLKNCGWLEEEVRANHEVFIQLTEYTIPFIESIISIIESEELEYQGVISRIVMVLKNLDESSKPYEEIVIGVQDGMAQLVSELKRLNSSIKRRINDLTSKVKPEEILDSFELYNAQIISKSYYRLKTSDNISRFRQDIYSALDRIILDETIRKKAIAGYIEVKSSGDTPLLESEASDRLASEIQEIRRNFDRLDDIIHDIDEKNRIYMRTALNRARFLLSAGNNIEGKINLILKSLSSVDDFDLDSILLVNDIFAAFPQRFISDESLRTVPQYKKLGSITTIRKVNAVSEDVKQARIAEIREKQKNQITPKKINQFVLNLLGDKNRIGVSEIPITEIKDFFKIIYIVVYSSHYQSCYRIEKHEERILLANRFRVKSFDIVRRGKRHV